MCLCLCLCAFEFVCVYVRSRSRRRRRQEVVVVAVERGWRGGAEHPTRRSQGAFKNHITHERSKIITPFAGWGGDAAL